MLTFTTKSDFDSLRYEYLFYRAVDAYNKQKGAQANFDGSITVDGLILKSAAINLHDQIDDMLYDRYGQNLAFAHKNEEDGTAIPLSQDEIVDTMRTVLTKATGEDLFANIDVDEELQAFDEWAYITTDQYGNTGATGFIALSPYDKRFRRNSIMIGEGTQTVLLRDVQKYLTDVSAIMSGEQMGGHLPPYVVEGGVLSIGDSLDERVALTKSVTHLDAKGTEVPSKFVNFYDYTGVSALIPYIGNAYGNKDEVRDLLAWAQAPYVTKPEVAADHPAYGILRQKVTNAMSPDERERILVARRDLVSRLHAQMETACNMICEFRDRGFEVEVRKAKLPGQLEAYVHKESGARSGVLVRLTGEETLSDNPLKNDALFQGHTYDTATGVTAQIEFSSAVRAESGVGLGYNRPTPQNDPNYASDVMAPALSLLGVDDAELGRDEDGNPTRIGKLDATFWGHGVSETRPAQVETTLADGQVITESIKDAMRRLGNRALTAEEQAQFNETVYKYTDTGRELIYQGLAREYLDRRPTFVGDASNNATYVGVSPINEFIEINGQIQRVNFDYTRIRFDASNHVRPMRNFGSREAAEDKLKNMIQTAYNTAEDDIDVIELIEGARALRRGEPGLESLTVGDATVTDFRARLYAMLNGETDYVDIPNLDEANDVDIDDPTNDIFGENDDATAAITRIELRDPSDEQEREQLAFDATRQFLRTYIGSYAPDETGHTFNPSHVAAYSGGMSVAGQKDLIRVMRAVWRPNGTFTVDDAVERARMLRGSDIAKKHIADQLACFDETKAESLTEMHNEAKRHFMETARDAIQSMGYAVDDADIKMDNRGIIHYTATRRFHAGEEYQTQDGWKTADEDTNTVVNGEIGQIFVPNHTGLIDTNYIASDNVMLGVGYKALVESAESTGISNMAARTKLVSYMDQLDEAIRAQVRSDIATSAPSALNLGEPTSMNVFYRHLDADVYPQDYMEQQEALGKPRSLILACIENSTRKVVFDRNLVMNSGIIQAWEDVENIQHNWTGKNGVLGDDMQNGDLGRVGRLFLAPDEEFAHRFSINDTQDNARLLGTVYVSDDFQLDEDGHVIKQNKPVQSPMSAWLRQNMPSSEYDTLFRSRMAISNLRDSEGVVLSETYDANRLAAQDLGRSQYRSSDTEEVTKGVIAAQMTMRGWVHDDAMVISEEFAKNHMVADETERAREGGNPNARRPLQVGDKISDFHGNKGVVGVVIDRNWTYEKAKKYDLVREWDMFKHNPALDLVFSPYSGMSRDNAGTARDMMKYPHNLQLVNERGKWQLHEASAGEIGIIIHDKTADHKTTFYDGDSERGRNIGWQLSSSLIARGCDGLMSEVFGSSERGAANLREHLLVCGIGMSDTGRLSRDVSEQMEGRRVIHQPVDVFSAHVFDDIGGHISETTKAGRGGGSKAVKRAAERIAAEFDRSGGILEVPFPLNFTQFEEKGEAKTLPVKDGRTQVPVLSVSLRSGIEDRDGMTHVHDYTNKYVRIYQDAIDWRLAQNVIDNPSKYAEAENKRRRGKYRNFRVSENDLVNEVKKRQAWLVNDAQSQYDAISRDIMQQNLVQPKWNDIAGHIMRAKVSNQAATAIWTPDPRLDIDQVKVGRKLAEVLNVKNNDYIMVARDPSLVSSAVRGMRVLVDDAEPGSANALCGIAVNPVVTTAMTGDFDGDTVAVMNPHSAMAKRELKQKLSFESNILDFDRPRHDLATGELELDANGNKVYDFDLGITGGDFAVARNDNPEVARKFEELRVRANQELPSREAIQNDPEVYAKARALVRDMSHLVRETLNDTVGTRALCFGVSDEKGFCKGDTKVYLQSAWDNIVKTGAKGNLDRFTQFCDFMGVDGPKDGGKFAVDNEGNPRINEFVDTKKTFCGDEQRRFDIDKSTLFAMGTKSQITGMAGTVAKVGIAAVGGHGSEYVAAAQNLSEVPYQMTLDVKTDPARAKKAVAALTGGMKNLLHYGIAPVRAVDGYQEDVDYDKATGRLSKDRWCERVFEEYNSIGLAGRINPDEVAILADALARDGKFVDGFDTVAQSEDIPMLYAMGMKPSVERLFEAANTGRSLADTGRYVGSSVKSGLVKQTDERIVQNSHMVSYLPDGMKRALYEKTGKPGLNPLNPYASHVGVKVKSDVRASVSQINAVVPITTNAPCSSFGE